MELTINGFLYEAKEIETLANGKPFKRIVIKQPARVNQFGEIIGQENFFEITIFGQEKIEEAFKGCPAKEAEKGLAKLSCIAYVNGSQREFNGKMFYNVQLTYKALKWII